MLAVERAGGESLEVRDLPALESSDALIIPGGESSTMAWLLDRFNLREPLIDFIQHKPVWGTCAGLILLASELVESSDSRGVAVQPLGALDVSVARNAYGRQIHSFEDQIRIRDKNVEFTIQGSFIRAPRITRVGPGVEVLASVDDTPVLVRSGLKLGSSFHSELHDDPALTRYFIDSMVRPHLECDDDVATSDSVGTVDRSDRSDRDVA